MSDADDAGRPTLREGRLSRWSRLKRQGGDGGDAPEAPAPAETAYAIPDPNALPGGAAIRRHRAPVMPSLVGDDDGPAPVVPVAAIEPEEARELTPEEAAVVAELPPIESLTKDSDFTPFLADKVPDFIRRRALSVLWRSDPVFGHLDGLNDYDLNYRVIDTLIDVAKDTIYRVGKGHGADEDEEATEAVDTTSEAETEAGDTTAETEVEESAEAPAAVPTCKVDEAG